MSEILESLPEPIQAGLKFDLEHWATGSVADDPFYSASDEHADAVAGALLKLDPHIDVQKFTLPISTALSRFIYQSKKLDGTLVPVSAYVLWPFTPRSSDDGFQVVAWAHGTSGISPDSAPSHIKNLWQHYLAPFQLALQGYVVISTDYSGLGVGRDASGNPIFHDYMASSSQANDVIYAIQAARSAFPELSKSFVVVGHSQGGGAAWACARRQAIEPTDGYLGAVALSPVTEFLAEPEPMCSVLTTAAIPGIESYFPGFKRSHVMTEEGMQRLGAIQSLGACMAPGLALLMGVTTLNPNFKHNKYIQAYQAPNVNAGKDVSGPLLIVHGENDPLLNIDIVTRAIETTAHSFPHASIKFIQVSGISHNASMTSTQHIWMDWIADRFAGKRCSSGFDRSTLKAARPIQQYLPEMNWFVESAKEFYQTP